MELARRGQCNGRVRSWTRLVAVAATACALALAILAAGASLSPARALTPTLPPIPEGRHVFDYGNLLSPNARTTAERLASEIESGGGGRVVIYTADLTDLPSADSIVSDWQVDGLLLTGWDSVGSTRLGKTLQSRLTATARDFLKATTAISVGFESWATSTLARAEAFLQDRHVFDGAGVLSVSDLSAAESKASSLGSSIGAGVYIDVARGDSEDAYSTAFSNGTDLSWRLDGSVVIALAVSGKTLGGYVDADSDFWSAYATNDPWVNSSIANEVVPSGDLGAAVMRAIDGVSLPPDPAKAVGDAARTVSDAVTGSVRGFVENPTNQRWSFLGFLLGLLSIVAFQLDRWRRRRDGGYGDDDSVILPAPPSEMTPALAALMAAPLDTTRAVTAALLDLAAHGFIAFYQPRSPASTGGVAVVSDGGSARRGPIHSTATERPLGQAESELLAGLRAWSKASGAETTADAGDFAVLRPLFERTAERLEEIAGSHGWLNLRPDIASLAWLAYGALLLVATAAMALIWQPIAAVALWYAALVIMPRAFKMPLPLRTREGQMTSATVDAYRRTLKRALSSEPGTVPLWLANAEEAALWGYAWGLEGEVQDFVARNVAAAMDVGHGESDDAATRTANLRAFSTAMGPGRGRRDRIALASLGIRSPAAWRTLTRRPIGLDTSAIGGTLAVFGGAIAAEVPDEAPDAAAPGTAQSPEAPDGPDAKAPGAAAGSVESQPDAETAAKPVEVAVEP